MTKAPYPTITAKIICDSYTPSKSSRLTTFELTYPRYIHSEIMTHRVLSRNAQSSRAIPVKRRIGRVRTCPVKPIRWGANQSGMQAKDTDVEDPGVCETRWLLAAEDAANHAEKLMEAGLHKQWANRLLEPFDTITVIATGTQWENMFGLRCDPDAQPEFQNVAWKMADLYYNNEPATLEIIKPVNLWHLPYVSLKEQDYILSNVTGLDAAAKVMLAASVARCARVSYLNHDGSSPDLIKDKSLHDRLLADGHISPFEHQAKAATNSNQYGGNFGSYWTQYRKTLTQPEVRKFNYQEAIKNRPWDEPYTGESE